MAFKKKTFIDGATVIDAKFLNDIQDALIRIGEESGRALTDEQISLLETILANIAYTDESTGQLAAKNLISSLRGSETKFHTVTYSMTNCSSSNDDLSVEDGNPFKAVIMANTGYAMVAITVMMGGVDITATAVSGGDINISAVTGDVVITATATATEPGEEITASVVNGKITTNATTATVSGGKIILS